MSARLEAVSTTRNGRVAIVAFLPAEDGTISNKGAALLTAALDKAIADADTRAVVLTGKAPGTFIRHANVAQIARAADAVARGDVGEEAFASSPFAKLCSLLDRSPKPVVAAINGPCMGGGFEIALACTFRIASADVAHIGLPEIRIGIPPGAGGPQRLARLIGEHRSRMFSLQGRTVDAAEAERLGLVDAVAADALAAAIDEASSIAARSPAAVEELMRQFRPRDEAAIDANLRGFAQALVAPGTREALAEFLASGEPLEARG